MLCCVGQRERERERDSSGAWSERALQEVCVNMTDKWRRETNVNNDMTDSIADTICATISLSVGQCGQYGVSRL